MIENLVKQFTDKEAAVTAEEEKAVAAHEKYMKAATKSMEDYKNEKEEKEDEKEKTEGEIAELQEELVNLEAELKDNQTYLKDLTGQCELKAREWDQQTQMRADELSALGGAIDILLDKVAPKDVVNQRALLQQEGEEKETVAPAVDDLAEDDVR